VVIRALMCAVADWGGRRLLSGALTVLVYWRLSKICLRMERLAARFEGGRVWRPGLRLGGGRAVSVEAAARRVRVWPLGFCWLIRMMGWQAAGYGSQLRAVLEQPEMVALLVAAPQAARILRPVCRMLGIETSLLRPGVAGAVVEVVPATSKSEAAGSKRVRKRPEPIDFGRIPLPRGVLAAARRHGFKPCR
jgi:hypothetical protein